MTLDVRLVLLSVDLGDRNEGGHGATLARRRHTAKLTAQVVPEARVGREDLQRKGQGVQDASKLGETLEAARSRVSYQSAGRLEVEIFDGGVEGGAWRGHLSRR